MIKRLYYIRVNPTVGSCVYKLTYAGRYVIVKAKDMDKSAHAIQRALNQFLREAPSQRRADNLYYHFFTYIEKTPDKEIEATLILESKSAYELLQAEYTALKAAMKDKACLNNNTDPYLPAYNDETGMYGWIPKADYLNFKKWLKRKKPSVSL